jgi:tetratricopeptide (TPR) repeat protein
MLIPPPANQGRFSDMSPEEVARNLLKKGEGLGREEPRRLEDELTVYNELIHGFWESESPEIQKLVAVAMLNKAEAVHDQATSSPYAEQIDIYDSLLQRFGDNSSPVLHGSLAQAMFKRADVFGWLPLPNLFEEIAGYEMLIQRFWADSELDVRECVAKAMVERARTLRRLEPPRLTDAITSLEEMIRRFWADVESSVRGLVLNALSLKACWLSCDERPIEAIEACDEVIRYVQLNSNLESSSEFEAEALRRKGNAFLELEPPRLIEAIALYDEVTERFGDTEDVSLLIEVARAMLNKGTLYSEFDRPEEACAVYDEIIARFGKDMDEDLFLQKKASEAMLQKGALYLELDRPEEAIALYDELIEHFDGRWNMVNVFCALFNKGCALIDLERFVEADAAYSNLIERYDGVRNRHKSFRNDELQEIYEKAHDMKSQISSLKEKVITD